MTTFNDKIIKKEELALLTLEGKLNSFKDCINLILHNKVPLDWDKLNSINWNQLCSYYILDDYFIDYYIKYFNFNVLAYSQKLSERIIEKYKDKWDWHIITKHQVLSEDFIEKNLDKLDSECWNNISKFQKLNQKFINKYYKYINKKMLLINQAWY